MGSLGDGVTVNELYGCEYAHLLAAGSLSLPMLMAVSMVTSREILVRVCSAKEEQVFPEGSGCIRGTVSSS